MKRKIIEIDEEKCNGCGLCIPNCQEGALQMIDGKARLIGDLFCDGLGACIGHCPEGAIEMVEREAEPYNERMVMEQIIPKGRNNILAHQAHMRDHNEQDYLDPPCGCPGAVTRDFTKHQTEPDKATVADSAAFDTPSELRQWPVQLHLVNPGASYFRNADVVLAADCVPFALGNFHARFLKGKSLAIACPKLDSNKESYIQKLVSMIRETRINSLSVLMMEVPCCGVLLAMAETARAQAGRNIPVRRIIVSIQGEILEEDWV